MMYTQLPEENAAMELAGDSTGVIAIVVAIFLATGVYMWQSSRSDAKIDRVEAKLETEIKEQGGRLESEIKERGERLEAEIRLMSRRVSDSELEQARLNGVNSVLANQTHTHEGAAD